VDAISEAGARTIVASGPHCFNTIANEYPQLGGNYEVIHHTQLLAKLVEQGRLTPLTPVEETITYHDPCFLGRHNKVFTPPRQIMEQVPGGTASGNAPGQEPRLLLRGGRRPDVDGRTDRQGINAERVDEALATDPDTVSTACPYCLVMLGDAISAKKASGEARETLEVVDVAQTKRPPA